MLRPGSDRTHPCQKVVVLIWLALTPALLLPGGCASVPVALSQLQENEVNLTDFNYSAADALSQQAKARISPQAPIRFGRLYNRQIGANASPSPLARAIIEQITTRFVQLGYTVESRYDADIPDPESGGADESGAVIVEGSFAPGSRDVSVHLRMRHTDKDRILGAFDYRIPLNSEIRAMIDGS